MAAEPIEIRLLGPMEVLHAGQRQPIPASRKTRALLALLALEPRAHRREQLCETLWPLPDDPRAALRWSLSKIRPLVGTIAGASRLLATNDSVRLDAAGLLIDACVLRETGAEPGRHPTDRLQAAADLAAGDLLAGEAIDHAPLFDAWLYATREALRAVERAVRRELIARLSGDPIACLREAERLICLDPLAPEGYRAQIAALNALARPADAETALARARALFAREGLPFELATSADPPAGTGPIATNRAAVPVAPIEAAPVEATPSDQPTPIAMSKVAVMPFAAVGDTPAYLAQGLTDGVIDALSRFRTLMVNVRGLAAGPASPDPIDLGRSLDVDWIVTGQALVAGSSVRVRFRLIDVGTAALVWAGEEAAPAEDLFRLQDHVAGKIAAAIEPQVRGVLMERAARAAPGNAGAYDLLLRAMYHLYGGSTDFAVASDLLEEALRRDPDFALANALLPWTAFMAGRILSPEAAARYAALAHRAERAAPEEAFVLAMAGTMTVILEHAFEAGRALCDRAIRVNPNSIYGWTCRGWVRTYSGEYEGAMADFDRADSLNFWPLQDYNVGAGRALCCFQAGRLPEALHWADWGLARVARNADALRWKAAILAELGDLAGARQARAKLLEISPGERVSLLVVGLPFRRRETAERLGRALALAGLPD